MTMSGLPVDLIGDGLEVDCRGLDVEVAGVGHWSGLLVVGCEASTNSPMDYATSREIIVHWTIITIPAEGAAEGRAATQKRCGVGIADDTH